MDIFYSMLKWNFSPIKPNLMDWSSLFPHYFSTDKEESKENNVPNKCVEFADIGCGYGGLLGKNSGLNFKYINV